MTTSLLDKAITLSTAAHSGTTRKGTSLPYIVHPMEAVSIVATMTDDQEMLAAAALHDVVEDCGVTISELEKEFGERVASLVAADSNAPRKEGDTWRSRKQAALDRLAAAPLDAKTVAMGDKLSNLRAIDIDYQKEGESLWRRFKAPNGREDIEWYYRGLAKSLSALQGTAAYDEFTQRIESAFKQ